MCSSHVWTFAKYHGSLAALVTTILFIQAILSSSAADKKNGIVRCHCLSSGSQIWKIQGEGNLAYCSQKCMDEANDGCVGFEYIEAKDKCIFHTQETLSVDAASWGEDPTCGYDADESTRVYLITNRQSETYDCADLAEREGDAFVGGSRQIKIRNRILDVFCFKPPGFDTFQTYFDMSGYVYYGGAGDKRYSKMRIEVHDCLVNVDVLDDSFSEVRYWQEGNPTIVAAMHMALQEPCDFAGYYASCKLNIQSSKFYIPVDWNKYLVNFEQETAETTTQSSAAGRQYYYRNMYKNAQCQGQNFYHFARLETGSYNNKIPLIVPNSA